MNSAAVAVCGQIFVSQGAVFRYGISMRIDVITLFPGMFQGPLTESILKRAQDQGLLQIQFHDLRELGLGAYHQIDDSPYGGGAGMVMKADVLVNAIEAVSRRDTSTPDPSSGGGGDNYNE